MDLYPIYNYFYAISDVEQYCSWWIIGTFFAKTTLTICVKRLLDALIRR
jgi:hypothetical protein